jgi:thioesterase domain-containing protein
MAKRHLAALRTVQPAGPYRLGGSCNGGLVALEMARCLLQEGEKVDRLILIGATAINVRWKLTGGPIGVLGWCLRRCSSRSYDRFLMHALAWDSLDLSARPRFLLGAIARGVRDLVQAAMRPKEHAPPLAPRGTSDLADHRERTREAYRRIDKDYTPAPYPGRVVVLWPSDDIERPQAAKWWAAVAREVSFLVVPGNHATSPTDHVEALADALRRCLADESGDCRAPEARQELAPPARFSAG